ncbi:hypothetical protein [Serratia sp. (in: enterobacteria)]|uniref:hypothetical protein n=1 Tax=Serratia sp. (in: enterobacteria) TaxID=616 RepID=UPI0040384668
MTDEGDSTTVPRNVNVKIASSITGRKDEKNTLFMVVVARAAGGCQLGDRCAILAVSKEIYREGNSVG